MTLNRINWWAIGDGEGSYLCCGSTKLSNSDPPDLYTYEDAAIRLGAWRVVHSPARHWKLIEIQIVTVEHRTECDKCYYCEAPGVPLIDKDGDGRLVCAVCSADIEAERRHEAEQIRGRLKEIER